MTAVIVLGMHRSYTSLTAKALHEQDNVTMGDNLYMEGKGNEKGHFEDKDFMRMNKNILANAGGSWVDPPDREDILAVNMGDDIEELVEKKREDGLWGFKDPRTTLTIEKYMPYLENPVFVVNFREPIEVGKSLNRRGGITVEDGTALAQIYNERLIDFLKEFSVNNVCYNKNDAME